MSVCDEARERIWDALDSGSELPDHCPACRAYAEQAGKLHSMLPQALGETPQTSVRGAVLDRIREESEAADLPQAWIPAAVLLSLAGTCALCVWMGWTEIQQSFFTTTAETPMKTAAAAAAAAAVASWIMLKRRDSHV